jgi:hypothetical protein
MVKPFQVHQRHWEEPDVEVVVFGSKCASTSELLVISSIHLFACFSDQHLLLA